VEAAMADLELPPGYSWGRGTQWRKQQEAGNDMLINLALCLLLVYAVMASLFESFLQPLGILVTCLLGCFGAPWALWLTGTTLDTTAIVGFFILIGVVVNNGIMLVDRVTWLRAHGMERDEALQQAGRDRIRPILMTVTTSILGLLPMLIHHPTLAGVYYHSIAIVIAGGLTTSTLLTLMFLPAAYAMLEDLSRSAQRGFRRLAPRRR
jgi:hydrophobic/amphiphilic exporter-1 (mainly G- bacteria), HAE1 family